MPDTYIDGDFTMATAVGPKAYEYPFRKNGDLVTAHFTEDYWQRKATWLPSELKTSYPQMPDFYLIDDGNPVEQGAGIVKFSRIYSRIPAQQTIPGSRFITKPNLPGEFPQVSGNSLIVQPDENVPRWVFYTNLAVASDSGAPNGSSPTGGTYTITAGASTTGAINYNASAASVQTALNALTSISDRGAVVVIGHYTTGFRIIFDAYAIGSIDHALLAVGAAKVTDCKTVNGVLMLFEVSTVPRGSGAAISSGSFTVTIFGQTTGAIAYNASLATLTAAITGLSKVGATGTTVSQPSAGYTSADIRYTNNTRIEFLVAMTKPAVSVTGSLTPSGSSITSADTTNGIYVDWTTLTLAGVTLSTRVLFSAAHGISASDGIVLTQGANYRSVAAGLYTVDTNTITLTSASGAAFSTSTLITYVGKLTGSEYTAGNKLTRVKRVTDYYLPGVSVGIATIDDIPLPTYEGDDASLLAAIFNGNTAINYEVGELELYRDGPIVQRIRTTLDASQL